MQSATFGPSVRTAREAAKLSQSAVAQAIGMNRMYYSLFEAGRYLLDETEESALRTYLDSQAVKLPANESVVTVKPSPSKPAADPRHPGEEDDDDQARIATAEVALEKIATTVQESGLDSKRTAFAVRAATAALQDLDYPELLSLAAGDDESLNGLPEATKFAELTIEGKQLWESRAAGMLICRALYGDAWQSASCDVLSRAARWVRRMVPDREWNVKELDVLDWGFFLSPKKDKLLPNCRCELAPHIAKAAETRHAPALV